MLLRVSQNPPGVEQANFTLILNADESGICDGLFAIEIAEAVGYAFNF